MNYNFIKPELTDPANITTMNENWDKVDAKLKEAYSPDNKPTATDIGARPSTWMPTADDIGAKPSDWLPTITEIGAAPSGFGLGEVAGNTLTPSTVYTEQRNGTYEYYDSTAQNLVPGFSSYRGTVIISGNSRARTLTFINNFGFTARRYMRESGNSYEPWEYVNPPMSVNSEYRTTERYKSKPVYAKLVNFGKLPNTAQSSVAHGVSNPECIFSVEGTVGDYGTLSGNKLVTSYTVNNKNITINTSGDLSGYDCYVLIKYTKSTDSQGAY